jgi:hypothetical protein
VTAFHRKRTRPKPSIHPKLRKAKFIKWLFRGTGGPCGLSRIINPWLALHALGGTAIAYLVERDPETVANAAILPLASILVGLVFAWSGNAQALLQQPEIEAISGKYKGGIADWVFQYQLAIAILLFSLIVWGLTAMGVSLSSTLGLTEFAHSIAERALLYSLSIVALRECWSVISSASSLLILRKFILDHAAKPKTDASKTT